MAISDSLVTAHEHLLRVIPEPRTLEEERLSKPMPAVDPAAVQDAARRFVDALCGEPGAADELRRRGTLVATLTGQGSQY